MPRQQGSSTTWTPEKDKDLLFAIVMTHLTEQHNFSWLWLRFIQTQDRLVIDKPKMNLNPGDITTKQIYMTEVSLTT